MDSQTETPSLEASSHPPLSELEQRDDFVMRHIGTSPGDQKKMLGTLGYSSRAALINDVVPTSIRRHAPPKLSPAQPEAEALALLKQMAASNKVYRSFIGQGYYPSHTPTVILRNVLENPAWYTAYTPYQPEISQGRLEAIANFQTMVTDLTKMDIANASMLDESTAAAEAVTLCQRVGKSSSTIVFVADDVFPQTIEVLRTRTEPLGLSVVVGTAQSAADSDCLAAVLQYPSAQGAVESYRELTEKIHGRAGLVIVATDLLALTLFIPPGEWGADVVVGNSQRFGVALGFGGPHAAFMATRDTYKRNLPGRLVGATIDAQGNPAYRLALQTREQHIRREKATSNICTAQVLLAVMASMYAVYHGPLGLLTIARRTQRLTSILAVGLKTLGVPIENATFFDTLTLHCGPDTAALHVAAHTRKINLRMIDSERLGISLDETKTRNDVEMLWEIFAQGTALPQFDLVETLLRDEGIHSDLKRRSTYLTHPVFNRYHSETEMLRYLRRLADKDIALDRAMIALGSCTMKLNATSEMLPVSWPEFAQIHPFAPADQTEGYRAMIVELESMLCEATGYAAVSLQPNAGSQGEYAGLLIIRAYHRSRGDKQRNICLIPSSAHGTNPASAHMAGMQIVVVSCDIHGNVDLEDLQAKASLHARQLAAIMITYPSTHGVFEPEVEQICRVVHQNGGQVYIDGANLNALVGIAAPGHFGGDVSHLNLHKTFCIPHGGGGPGVGPVAVAAHLSRFLPNHRAGGYQRDAAGISAVSGAPYGSASILPISWMYITMMGRDGLTAATESAILAANYIARKLEPCFPVLYKGEKGLVAHECILDLRPIKESSGISVEDVAKRLIDFGFHAPTMSFPVPGTLMVEPTESESLTELDRFIAAMIVIREEIRAVEDGRFDRDDNPLKHAPHTAAVLLGDEWTRCYSRVIAAYPGTGTRADKYWPPVGRADNVYGDRNLQCGCISTTEYE